MFVLDYLILQGKYPTCCPIEVTFPGSNNPTSSLLFFSLLKSSKNFLTYFL